MLFLLHNVERNITFWKHIYKFFTILFVYITNFIKKQIHKQMLRWRMSFIVKRDSLTEYDNSQFYYICSKTLKVFCHLISELYHKLRKLNFFKLLLQQKCGDVEAVFDFKSIFSEIIIATYALFCLLFAWIPFCHLFTLSMCVLIYKVSLVDNI